MKRIARRQLFVAASLTLALGASGAFAAEPPVVAVAANFTAAAERIAGAFEAETGAEVKLTTGSTGKLYAQIRAGAPFAIMLAADAATPERLEAEGFAAPGSRFTYAVGQLVLWSAAEGRFGDDMAAALGDPSVKHIAIANPKLAPYGAAAQEALTAMGLWERVRPKIVMGENIGQTFAMVDSGAAAVGFVALSAARPPDADAKGSLLLVPADAYAPIRQDAVLLLPGVDDETAKAFFAFLGGETARAITASYGYGAE